MTALAISLLWKAWPFILAVGGALLWGLRQRSAGAAKERAKQAAADAKARTIADEIDDAVAGHDPSENRKELKTW